MFYCFCVQLSGTVDSWTQCSTESPVSSNTPINSQVTASQLTASSQHTDSTYFPDSDTDIDMTDTQSVEDMRKYLVFKRNA